MKIMKSKLDEKWKKSDELEREVQNYQVLLAKQMSTTSALERENAALQKALDSKNAELQNLLASKSGEDTDKQVDESMDTTHDVDVDTTLSQHEDTINLGESLEGNEDENMETSIHYDHADQCNIDTNLEDEVTLAEMSSVIKKRKLSQEVVEELTLADIVDPKQVMPKTPANMTTDEIVAQLRQDNPGTFEAMSPAIAMLQLLEQFSDLSKVSVTRTDEGEPKEDTVKRSNAMKNKSPSSLVKKVKARGGRKENKDERSFVYQVVRKGDTKK